MVINGSVQYNGGVLPEITLLTQCGTLGNPFVAVIVVSRIQRIGCQPEKLLYTVANPARGLLNREKRKEKAWQHTHPPHCSFGEKINK